VIFFEKTPFYSAEHTALPSLRLPNALVAVYWTDLWAGSGHGVFVKTTGSVPHRHCVIQWDRTANFGSTATGTFQIVLEETSSKIWLTIWTRTSTIQPWITA